MFDYQLLEKDKAVFINLHNWKRFFFFELSRSQI